MCWRGASNGSPLAAVLLGLRQCSASKSTLPAAASTMLPRAIALLEIGQHLVAGQVADAARRAQHALAQRMRAEERRHALLVRAVRRLIVVLGDLFQDHLLLGIEILLPQHGPHHVGQQLDDLRLVFGQRRGVIDRLLFAGEGVGAGAELVQLAIDIGRRALGRALEDHVLEKMADAGNLVRLVARARANKERVSRRIGARRDLRDDFQAVIERVML